MKPDELFGIVNPQAVDNAHIGMGCMRLSTERNRDEARAIEVLHAAFDLGVTFLDTADAYCLNDSETGHNERLIARALKAWRGDRSRIVVATKGGLTRPDGRWVPDGRGRHLRTACEASLKALDVARIDLYQLHAPDPRVPFATSVRAMAALKDDGLVARIGLCNVNVGQIQEARGIAEIAAIQIELSVWHDDSLLGGVVDYCLTHGIQVIAYRPLGGRRKVSRLRHEVVLKEVAERCRATPAEIALAWLATLSDRMVTIPGATRIETVQSIVRAHGVQLSTEDRERLDARFRAGGSEDPPLRTRAARRGGSLEPPSESEVVLVMGLPGAGKSTAARNKALIVWCDGTLIGDVAADLQIRRADVLRRYRDEGWLLLGVAWRPQIADKSMTVGEADAGFARLQEQFGVSIEVLYCPHAAGPPTCWCRKPLPGLGVVFIQRHRLDPSRCIYVGSGPQDPGFARRLGFQYRDAVDFFALFESHAATPDH